MKILMVLAAIVIGSTVVLAEVSWTRLNGKVKGINGKTSQITIQNKEDDLLTVKVDSDVTIIRDKAQVTLKDITIDDKVTLMYLPRPATQKDAEEPPEGSIYPPFKK